MVFVCWFVLHVPLCGGCFIRHGCLSWRRVAPVLWTVPQLWGTHGYGSEFQWAIKSPYGSGCGCQCSVCIGSTSCARTHGVGNGVHEVAGSTGKCADHAEPFAGSGGWQASNTGCTAFGRDAQVRYIQGGRAKLVEEPDLTTLKDVKFFVKPPDFSSGGARGKGNGGGRGGAPYGRGAGRGGQVTSIFGGSDSVQEIFGDEGENAQDFDKWMDGIMNGDAGVSSAAVCREF